MTLPEAIRARHAWNWFVYEYNLDDTNDASQLSDIKLVGEALDQVILSKGGNIEDGNAGKVLGFHVGLVI